MLAGVIVLQAEAPSEGSSRRAVDRLLAQYGTTTGPGCAVGVLQDQRVVLQTAAGTADGLRPLTADTPMYLASVSKQFTAAAVYRLAAMGKVRLSEPIGSRLTELTSVTAEPTIQQLLNHTSGLRDYSALQEVAGRLDESFENTAILRLLTAQRALNFAPGTDYEYSNSDYVLLSLLIERVSGHPLSEFVRREFFEPLAMRQSWFGSSKSPNNGTARGYALRDGILTLAAPPISSGDGGMYSSVSDLLRWMQELKKRGRASSDPLRQIQIRARLKSGEALPHASGLFWNRYRGRETLSHNGAVAGFQADVVHFPKEHLSVVCVCNRGDVDAASISRQVAEAYWEPERQKATARPAQAGRALADLAGVWQSRQGFILTTRVEGGRVITSLGGQTHTMFRGPKRSMFSTDSGTVRLFLRRRSKDIVELGLEGDRPNSFRRLRSGESKTTELAAYAGHYVNDELDVAWDLLVADRTLVVTTVAGWRIPLAQAAEDRFEVGPWLLEFDRDTSGVRAVRLHRERLWDLAFQRSAEPK